MRTERNSALLKQSKQELNKIQLCSNRANEDKMQKDKTQHFFSKKYLSLLRYKKNCLIKKIMYYGTD
jgi:hypothetical protein